MKKTEGRSRVSQPQEKNDVGIDPTAASSSKHEVSLVCFYCVNKSVYDAYLDVKHMEG